MAQGARTLQSKYDDSRPLLDDETTTNRRFACVSLTGCTLVTVAMFVAVGIWFTSDDGTQSATLRMMVGTIYATNTTKGTNGTTVANGTGCKDAACQLQNWGGWQNADAKIKRVQGWTGWEALPFVHSTSTSSTTTSITTTTTSSTSTTVTATTSTITTTKTTTTTTTTTTSTPCVVPEDGDDCYGEVVKAMYEIRENPWDYEGLSMWSSFEEVQDFLHKNREDSKCWLSCECETAHVGSTCYDKVLYARKTGIKEHPDWYPEGMTELWSFEAFQNHMWNTVNDSECLRPCRDLWRASPSTFCWSVSRNYGYEADVMRTQLEAGAGIFACDGFAVVSEQDWTVGDGPGKRVGTVKTVTFAHADVGVSKDGTAANALLFMNAWDAVIRKTFILDYEWAIKVDPDAVVLVDRLRDHLRDSTGQSVYVRNCNAVPSSPDFPMMFGSMEALSQPALQTYADNHARCKNELDWYSWGEDLFLGKCLLHLGVGPKDDFSIISDGVCAGVNCYNPGAAAFHPFKSGGAWMDCWNAASAGRGGAPPPLP